MSQKRKAVPTASKKDESEAEDDVAEYSEEELEDGDGSGSDGSEDEGPAGDGEPSAKRPKAAAGGPAEDDPLQAASIIESSDPLLRLQVKDLLSEVRADRATEADWVSSALPAARRALEAAAPCHLRAAEVCPGYCAAVGADTLKGELRMTEGFGGVELAGPVALGTGLRDARGGGAVDVLVHLPASSLWEKDHLNNRLAVKLVTLLTHVARTVAKLGPGAAPLDPAGAGIEFLGGDPRRPALVLPLKAAKGEAARALRLIPVVPVSSFSLIRLGPDRNSLRTTGKGGADDAAATASAPDASPPTPHYNQSVLATLLLPRVEEQCAAALAVGGAAARDGARLLALWLRAQGMDRPGTVGGGRLFPELVFAHLVSNNRLVPSMTPLQALKSAFTFLSDKKPWTADGGIATASPEQARLREGLPPPPSRAALSAAHPVLLLDTTGWVNLTCGVPRGQLDRMQLMAGRALRLLGPNAGQGAFDALFGPLSGAQGPAAAPWCHDYSYRVRIPRAHCGVSGGQEVEAMSAGSLSTDLPQWADVEGRVSSVLATALTDRARYLVVEGGVRGALAAPLDPQALAARGELRAVRPLSASAPTQHYLVSAHVGVDPDRALRAADVGPSPEDKAAAAEFRRFWGPKAELRRFKDGRISESVVWAVPASQRHHIPDLLAAYSLQRHLPEGTEVTGGAALLDRALYPGGGASGDAEEEAEADLGSTTQLQTVLSGFAKKLRALENLALSIQSVQPIGAAARGTLPYPPRPNPLAGGTPAPSGASPLRVLSDPCEVLVSLEGTGRWPDDPEAYFKMKAALGVQLSSALRDQLGVESLVSEDAVDAFVEGYALRLVLVSDRDAAVSDTIESRRRAWKTVQEQAIMNGRTPAPEPPPQMRVPDESAYSPLRRLVRTGYPDAAWHHGAIATVGATYPAYAPTVRLARRWIGAFHLSNHFAPEAVELMVAAVFHSSGCAEAPASRVAGLARFLGLLASHPFADRPLEVDLPSEPLTEAARRTGERAHREGAEAGKGPALALVTARDPEGKLWTGSRPTREVMDRTRALAARSLAQLRGALLVGKKGGSAEGAFDSSRALSDCDVILALRREALPHGDRATKAALAEAHGGQGRKPWYLSKSVQVPVASRPESRAVLRHVPAAMLEARGAKRLRTELLVGLDPLAETVRALEARLGQTAVVWSDRDSGTHLGISWVPKAFVPGPLRVTSAHLCVPAPGAEDSAEGMMGQAAVVPDASAVLQDVLAISEGLVEAMAVRS